MGWISGFLDSRCCKISPGSFKMTTPPRRVPKTNEPSCNCVPHEISFCSKNTPANERLVDQTARGNAVELFNIIAPSKIHHAPLILGDIEELAHQIRLDVIEAVILDARLADFAMKSVRQFLRRRRAESGEVQEQE